MRWRQLAFGLLWIALVIQFGWTVLHASWPASRLALPVVFTTGMLPLAVTSGRVRWCALLGRLTIGGAFLKALLERAADYGRFVQYTARVNSFLPHNLIPTVAALATVVECVLCVALLLGIKTQWVAGASAALLFLFATAMTISGLSQASWAVYVLSAGAVALTTADSSLLSVDGLLALREVPRMGDAADGPAR
jgi:uncharacterized membrane protein YphA (DoxX/SURF4 family)